MTPVEQTVYTNGKGNCLTACVASILDISISDVPEFCSAKDWFNRLEDFCVSNGFFLLYWAHTDSVPIIAIGVYLITLFELQDVTDELHAVIVKTKVKERIYDEVSGADRYEWEFEIIHDPNYQGTPKLIRPVGYILIGKQ